MQEWVRALSVVTMGVAIGMRVGERRVVHGLEAKGAVDPDTATKLPLTSFMRKWHFRRLLNAGVVGETMMQLQYLKVVEYAEWRARRRKRVLFILPVLLALVVYLLYFRRP